MNVLSVRFFWQSAIILGMIVGSLFFAGRALAADTVTGIYYIDADFNGSIDHAVLIFDENIDQCDYEAGDWTIDTAGTINITAITGISTDDPESTGDGACDGTDEYVYIDITTTANITGGATAPEISYTNQGTTGSLSGVTTAEISSISAETVLDGAAPVVLSTSPADDATGVSRTTDFVWTFSEAMVTTFDEGTEFSISPDPGGMTAAFSSGNTVATISLPALACGVEYDVTIDNTEIDASAGASTELKTTGPVDGDFSFTVTSSGCSSSPGSGGAANDSGSGDEEVTEESYEIDLASIADAMAGDFYTLTWTSSGNFDYVNLYYSTDGGESYMLLAGNTDNDGQYKWTIPEGVNDIFVKIEATDLVTSLAVDVESNNVSDEDEEEQEDVIEEEEQDAGPAWYVEGVEPGDVIRGESLSALYYITDEYERRVFISEAVYFTWYDDFDDVEWIADDDLAAFELGGLMLPQTGTVLVKIQSDPSVYALGEGEDAFTPVLRYVDSEERAVTLWGDDWADYVIDVEPTFIESFDRGDDVDDDFPVDMEKMKKREQLTT